MAYQVLARIREKVKARRRERAEAIKNAGGREDYVEVKPKKKSVPMPTMLREMWNDYS